MTLAWSPDAGLVGAGDRCRVRRGRVRREHGREQLPLRYPRPVFCPASRFGFSGQLREEGDIAVEFLRRTTDYCPLGATLPLII
jgi:hypothetical protein